MKQVLAKPRGPGVGIPSQMKNSLGENPQTYIIPKNCAWRIQLLPQEQPHTNATEFRKSLAPWTSC